MNTQELMDAMVVPSGTDSVKLGNVQIIFDEFAASSQPVGFAIAAAANALAESGWNAGAKNLVGRDRSYGLFQINTLAPHWKKYSPSFLVNPRNNTRLILDVELLAGAGNRMRRMYEQGSSSSQLTAAFTEDIERPSNASSKGQQRAAMARKLFPSLANLEAKSLGIMGQTSWVPGFPSFPSLPSFDFMSYFKPRPGNWTNNSKFVARIQTDEGPMGPGQIPPGVYTLQIKRQGRWISLPNPVAIDAGGDHVFDVVTGRGTWQ